MIDISRQRCLNHAHREAVARCPVCLRYFCRECITEHDQRVLCAACLHKESRSSDAHGGLVSKALRSMPFAAGFGLIWLFLYWIGRLLLATPTAFHEGTLWQQVWWK